MGPITFLHSGFLWLGLAAAAPIIVHLISRRRYRIVELPTVRFILQSARKGTRRSNLRYLLLLLMRMLMLAALVAIIARPSLRGAAAGTGDRPADAASVLLLIDDSFSMKYRTGGRRVFEAARAGALQVLDQVQPRSSVLLLTSSRPAANYWMDVKRARAKAQEDRQVGTAGDAWTMLSRAADEIKKQKLPHAEVFCFTDMTVGAWPDPKDHKIDFGRNVSVYLIDVGEPKPRNTAITALRNLGGPVFAGSRLRLEAEIVNCGAARDRFVELSLDGVKESLTPVKFTGPGTRKMDFTVRIPSEGNHVVGVRLTVPDELPEDDARFFVVDTPPPVKALVIDPAGIAEDAPASPSFFLRIALAPFGNAGAGFRVRHASVDRLNTRELNDADVVYLVDVPGVPPAVWENLRRFVVRGGGLGIFLGPGTDAASYNTTEAAKVMPGLVKGEILATDTPLRLRVINRTHPLVRNMQANSGVDLSDARIVGACRLLPEPGVETILSFGPDQPALLERRIGGRVLLFASSADESWGDLPHTNGYLPFVHEMSFFLANRQGGHTRNFLVGERVPVHYPKASVATRVLVQPPGSGLWEDLLEGVTAGVVYDWHTYETGLYRVRIVQGDKEIRSSFAVNAPPSESDVARVSEKTLRKSISAETLRFSSRRSALASEVHEGRTRGELVPWLIAFLLILLAAESALANRFYRY